MEDDRFLIVAGLEDGIHPGKNVMEQHCTLCPNSLVRFTVL